MPEVERLGVSGRETFYGGRPTERDPNQLVGDPEGGREVNIELHSLAHHGGHVVLTNTEVSSGLEPKTIVDVIESDVH